MVWKVSYYKTSSGRVPVIEYINNQETKRISKIRNSLRLLREFKIEDSLLKARKRMKDYIYG